MFSNFFSSLGSNLLGGFNIGGNLDKKLGKNLGAVLGDYIDESLTPDALKQKKSLNLNDIRTTSTNNNNHIPLIFGTVQISGQILWVSDVTTDRINYTVLNQGGWGFLPLKNITDYTHSISVAIGLCDGVIDDVLSIYADGYLLDLTQITYRVYHGTYTQNPDPLIIYALGADNTPAFIGTAYIVIENIPLEHFNDKIPEFTFTVKKSSLKNPNINNDITALCLIPASGEFVYATTPITRQAEFRPIYENMNMSPVKSDMLLTIDQLKQTYPNLQYISLVVGWFFDHTNPLNLTINAGIETPSKITSMPWNVAGKNRTTARYLSDYNGNISYGGTPADFAVTEGILALYNAGYKVTFYPFLFGDVPYNHPDNIPAYPWRGRITPTGTDTQKTNGINNFFNQYRPMILHYANMVKDINLIHNNAVDCFVIGSELVGLTHTKIGTSFPAVNALKTLCDDVRLIVGANVKITYGADWTEYGYVNISGSSVDFPLDILWASPNIDYVGIDWYAPLSDMRDGNNHIDAQITDTDHDINYLTGNIQGGQGYDWYYASDADRTAQIRTPITDGVYNKPWIYRYKDIRNWWKNLHYPRNSAGTESATPTSWIAGSKPIIFTELGCPAVRYGANSPNLFPDPKSSENGIPPFSDGMRDDAIQLSLIKSYLLYWTNNNEIHPVTNNPLMDISRMAIWCFDARPYPAFPSKSELWTDSPAFFTGHWITARGQGTYLSDIFVTVGGLVGLNIIFDEQSDKYLDGYIISAPTPRSMYQHLTELMDFYHLACEMQGYDLYIFARNQMHITNPYILSKNTLLSFDDSKSQTMNIPSGITLKYFDIAQNYDIATTRYKYPFAPNNTIFIQYILPICGFYGDIFRTLNISLSQYLKRNHEKITFSQSIFTQINRVGDIVIHNNKSFMIDDMTLDNNIITYHASPILPHIISPYKIPDNPVNPIIFYPQSDVNLAKIILDNKIYLAVSPTINPIKIQRAAVDNQGGISTYYDYIAVTGKSIFGITHTDFYNRPVGIVDNAHDIWVSFDKPYILYNHSTSDVLSGQNNMLIYNPVNGLYELISFETAELVDSVISKYRLSNIRRGLKNTVNAQGGVGNPVLAGTRIIMFDASLITDTTPYPDGISSWIYRIT